MLDLTTKCWIDTAAMMAIIAEANSKYPLETGGVLIGYRKDNEVIITDMTGPGPDAKHEPLYFDVDTKWTTAKADEIFDSTDGRLRFLGDWHSHPGGYCHPSVLDVKALEKVRDWPKALTPKPLMMIIGHDFSKWTIWELAEMLRPLLLQRFEFDRVAALA